MLPIDPDLGDLPDKWFCEMNNDDDVNNKCSASEKDSKWYGRHFSDQLEVLKDSPIKCIARDSSDAAIPQDQRALLVDRDEILKHLLEVTADKQKNSVISKYYFHDALLEETEDHVRDDIVDEAVGQEALSEDSEKASSTTAATRLHFLVAELNPSETVSTKNPTLEAVAQAASSCGVTGDGISTPPTRKRHSTPSAVNGNKKKSSVSPGKLKTPNTASSSSSEQTESPLPNESKVKHQCSPSSAKKEMKHTRMAPRGVKSAQTTQDCTPRKVKAKTLHEEPSSGQGGSPLDKSMVECHGTALSSTAKREKVHDRTSPRRLETDSTDSSREIGEIRPQQESKERESIDLVSSSSASMVEVIDLMDSTDLESGDESV
jgi:hypothetical protein